jgi:ornithine cyclodeaminase/alanine dehydrogenase-like protein (mu-crystallin family)
MRFNATAGEGLLMGVQAQSSGGAPNSRFLMLFDGESRALLAPMDMAPFNPVRGGAEGGLGAKHLASPGAKSLGMVGTGRQARTQLAAVVAAVPGLESIKVFSPTQEHRETFAREMSEWTGKEVQAVGSAAEAINDADIVDLVYTGPDRVVDTPKLKPGALVISITGRGQTPDDFLTGTRMVAPSWDILSNNQLREPYFSAIKAGSYTKEDYAGDLAAIITGKAQARTSPGDIVDFEATAMPILDHGIAEWAYGWARDNKAGTEFSIS